MPKKKAPELSDQERAKRIKEMAREVEADENGGGVQAHVQADGCKVPYAPQQHVGR